MKREVELTATNGIDQLLAVRLDEKYSDCA